MLTLKKFKESVMVVGDGSGTTIRGLGNVTGNPDGDQSAYIQTNLAYYDSAKDQILNMRNKYHNGLHKTAAPATMKEELKVGDKDDDGKYYAKKVGKKAKKKASKLKRKYRGKIRGTTHTGSPAHPINVQPTLGTPDIKR